MSEGLLIGVLVAMIGQSALLWWRIGRVEGSVKKAGCPFGECPLYSRAKLEAADKRTIEPT